MVAYVELNLTTATHQRQPCYTVENLLPFKGKQRRAESSVECGSAKFLLSTTTADLLLGLRLATNSSVILP